MKAARFDYVSAKTIKEASTLLGLDGTSTAVIAGGQSLLPMLNLRFAQPDLLVDICKLEELKEIAETPSHIRIGALTTHAFVEDGKLPDAFTGLLQRVASKISYRSIRHYGTIGGSVALADPAADWPGCLLALNATVRIAGANGERSELIDDFLQGQYATSLTLGEIIVGFDLPRPDDALRWGMFKVVRKSGAFANSIAFAVARGRGGPASVVLAAADHRPRLMPTVAETIRDRSYTDELLRSAIVKDMPINVSESPYLLRLHTSTVLRAVREMHSR